MMNGLAVNKRMPALNGRTATVLRERRAMSTITFASHLLSERVRYICQRWSRDIRKMLNDKRRCGTLPN